MKNMLVTAFAATFWLTASHIVVAEPTEGDGHPLVAESCGAATTGDDTLAQQGCCSWHGGVCGCSGTRTACCDGTLSPSCSCNSDDPPDVVSQLVSRQVNNARNEGSELLDSAQ